MWVNIPNSSYGSSWIDSIDFPGFGQVGGDFFSQPEKRRIDPWVER